MYYMNNDSVMDVLVEAGISYGSSGDHHTPIRIAKDSIGRLYAGRTEQRSDYADETVAFIDTRDMDYCQFIAQVRTILEDQGMIKE